MKLREMLEEANAFVEVVKVHFIYFFIEIGKLGI